jgi:hypothetical protein
VIEVVGLLLSREGRADTVEEAEVREIVDTSMGIATWGAVVVSIILRLDLLVARVMAQGMELRRASQGTGFRVAMDQAMGLFRATMEVLVAMVGTSMDLHSGETVDNKCRAITGFKAMLVKGTMGSREVSTLDQGLTMVVTVETLIAGDSDIFVGTSLDVEGVGITMVAVDLA